MKRWSGWCIIWLAITLVACGQTKVKTPTATAVLPSTTPTNIPTSNPLITPTPNHSVTPSPPPPITSSPHSLITPTPQPTLIPSPKPYATIDATTHPPGTAVPPPAPLFAKPDHITNIILLGNDVETPQGGRTDSLILVSIDRQSKTAVMLSLPRDLYVVIPGWRMTRINLALPHGHGADYPGAGGGLIRDTIEYNLGIPVDYYARIGFNGFKEAVDAIGGIEMVVNCSLTDWRLISPELDPTLEESWEQFTLEPGLHEMDGDLALWFARSRRTTNDFERGLRQQRVLQAIFNQGMSRELLPQLPDLWAAYQHNIETDMSLPLMLELAALAPTIQQNGIQHLTLPYEALTSWRSPTGGAVQLLQWETAAETLHRLMQPPLLNRSQHPSLTVEVVTSDYIMYRQIADNLAWYGFMPQYAPATQSDPPQTSIEYFGPNRKGSYDWLLSWLFHQEANNIYTVTDETSAVDYRVTLGQDANPCLSYLQSPAGK
ncbi:MAG: LCP family protein [Chloroflexi bacterium]|nr:LCP family protein [Chloroflexota bacterium]